MPSVRQRTQNIYMEGQIATASLFPFRLLHRGQISFILAQSGGARGTVPDILREVDEGLIALSLLG